MQQMMLYHAELSCAYCWPVRGTDTQYGNIKDLQVASSGQPRRFAAIFADLAEAKIFPQSSILKVWTSSFSSATFLIYLQTCII
jgi:hypothetical protein